jgi:putative transposase
MGRQCIQTDNRDNENKWTQSIAVGSKTFIEKMKEALGFIASGRKIICADDIFGLREVITPYGKAKSLNSGNTFLWKQPIDRLRIYRPQPFLIGQFFT